jgi:hypothetical protein
VIGATQTQHFFYINLQNKLWQVQREIFKWRFSSYILTVCEYILITGGCMGLSSSGEKCVYWGTVVNMIMNIQGFRWLEV